MKTEWCPIMSSAGYLCECKAERCEWWSDIMESCCVRALSSVMSPVTVCNKQRLSLDELRDAWKRDRDEAERGPVPYGIDKHGKYYIDEDEE